MGDYAERASFEGIFRDLQSRLTRLERPSNQSSHWHAVESGEVSTTSTGPTDLGGPDVRVYVPTRGIIGVLAAVELRNTGGGSAYVNMGGQAAPTSQIIQSASFGYEEKWSTPQGAGGAFWPYGAFIFFTALVDEGHSTVGLRYSSSGSTALFRNRRLWVAAQRGSEQ